MSKRAVEKMGEVSVIREACVMEFGHGVLTPRHGHGWTQGTRKAGMGWLYLFFSTMMLMSLRSAALGGVLMGIQEASGGSEWVL